MCKGPVAGEHDILSHLGSGSLDDAPAPHCSVPLYTRRRFPLWNRWPEITSTARPLGPRFNIPSLSY